MFFALSGFLITGSAQRLSLKNFMINRGMRIFPALLIEITLSSLVLGALFTDLPLEQYYGRGETWHYFTNTIGIINYYLPGVFTHNPKAAVNWSLWTVPYELGCYAIMGGLMVFKLLRRPSVVVALAAAFLGLGFLDLPVFGSVGSKLYIAFLLGIAAYLYRDRIPYSPRLFWGCVLFCAGLSLLRPAPWMTMPLLNLVVAPVAVYMTIFIGHTRIPRIPVLNSGDYSYGVYLYGNPIQQAVRAALPWTNTAWLNLLFSVPLILAFAAFSWHALEKQLLKLRKRFSFVARVRGVEGPGESVVGAPPPVDAREDLPQSGGG
jgi:peptidoglycan/LPS O-acetylase OafA/YrhL